MSDYVKILEGQLEELKRRLADSERLVDYWKYHTPHTFYITMHYEDKPIKTHSALGFFETLKIIDMFCLSENCDNLTHLHICRYVGAEMKWRCYIDRVPNMHFSVKFAKDRHSTPKFIKEYSSFHHAFDSIMVFVERKGLLDK